MRRLATSPSRDALVGALSARPGGRGPEVAAEVGFTDQAHLSRRFKRFLGATPCRFGRA
jgi:AraC-like DNA-binding protein